MASSYITRKHIGVFGCMNAGKSTFLNALAGNSVSIVDSTPGTTADVKTVLMEFHQAGPVKLFDTAGLDEVGELGKKKEQKTIQALAQCDLAVIVIDPLAPSSWSVEARVLKEAFSRGKDILVVFNEVSDLKPHHIAYGTQCDVQKRVHDCRQTLQRTFFQLCADKDLAKKMKKNKTSGQSSLRFIQQNLAEDNIGGSLVDRIELLFPRLLTNRIEKKQELLPWVSEMDMNNPAEALRGRTVLLNIPMDAETPGARLLRPQAMVQEATLALFGTTMCYRMDLGAARSDDLTARDMEKLRWDDTLQGAMFCGLRQTAADAYLESEKNDKPENVEEAKKIIPPPFWVVTDSQAIDVVADWTPEEVPLTTYSIIMANYLSGGRLEQLVEGLGAIRKLQQQLEEEKDRKPRILIVEACNHNRITDTCEDIGMVQLPKMLGRLLGGTDRFEVEHTFGRDDDWLTDPISLQKYDLVLHCGGCMLSMQQYEHRLVALGESGVPITNYGLFLSFAKSPAVLRRCLEPFSFKNEVLLDSIAPQ